MSKYFGLFGASSSLSCVFSHLNSILHSLSKSIIIELVHRRYYILFLRNCRQFVTVRLWTMEAKFFVYAGLRWRKLDVESGRVSGWAHRARFLVSRAGKLHRVRRSRVLRGLRALAAGQPSCVREAAPLPQRRHYSPKHEQRRHRLHCCCDTNQRALQHVQKVTLCNATTQTVVTLDAAVETLPRNRSPSMNQVKSGPLKYKTLLNSENPPQKKEKKTVVDKPFVKLKEASQTDTDTQSCKELIINEDDVDALRNFLDKNNLFDVDLESFDADDNYKSMVFYKINPLVSVERCPRIGRMYRRRNSNDISLADFATKLGLTAVTDLAVKKRYKMRKRGPLVGMSTESDKENRSDSSVMAVSDSSIDKSTTSKGPLTGQVGKKNIPQKGALVRPNKKNTLYMGALQRNSQSSNKSKVERVSTSASSESNDSGSEPSESESSDSDSAFESPSDRRSRLSRARNLSGSSRRKTRLQSPNDKGSNKIKMVNSHPIRGIEGNSPFNRGGMKSQPIQKVIESKLQSDQNASKPEPRPARRSEVDLLLDRGKSQSRSKKHNKSGTRTSRKTNESASRPDESASQSSRMKNESRMLREDKKSDIKHKENKSDTRHKKTVSDIRQKKNKADTKVSKNSKTDSKGKDNKYDTRQKGNKTDSRKNNKSDTLQLRNLDDSESQSSREENESDARATRKVMHSESSPKKKVIQVGGTEGQPASRNPPAAAAKRALRPPRANDSTISSYREYSSLEDHAIVAWVSRGARARLVNGNRVWRELQQEYARLVGVERSWHSLRNRYLRYILPRLGDLAISPPRASELRAAAARGEIKSSRRPPPPARSPARVKSAWGARPRPRLASSSDEEIPGDGLTDGGAGARAGREAAPAPPAAAAATARDRRSLRRAPPTPSYSELTRRFAPRLRSTPNASPAPGASSSSPSPRRRKLYNPRAAL